MSEEYIPLDYDILSVEDASQKSTSESTSESSQKSKSHHVTYIVVGIVLGVLVAVVLLVLLLLLWKRHTVKQMFCKYNQLAIPYIYEVYLYCCYREIKHFHAWR